MLNTKLFDHTILKADATEAQVAKICDEALAHDFASVCVNQYYTKFVAESSKDLTSKSAPLSASLWACPIPV